MKCPKCNNEMTNKGNLSGMVMTSNPPQWDSTYVCGNCNEEVVVRERGQYCSTVVVKG